MRTFLPLLVAVLLALGTAQPSRADKPLTKKERTAQCNAIRNACRTAWQGYMTYAKGYDALKPVSKTGRNWFGTSLLMTPVDAYDTFILLGMEKEAAEAKELILTKLRFDVDIEVQMFEVDIRLLGGLISGYEMTGEKKMLTLAEDLGRRLLPAFRSATGMPYRYVNLVTGKTRDAVSNPAEIGTCLLEFGKLTQLTGDSVFWKTAKKAAFEVYKRRSDIDLPGTTINVETGEWVNTESQIGARIDSYYEYLYKAWLLFGDRGCYEAWQIHDRAIRKRLLTETPQGDFFTRVDMRSGKETEPLYGALDAFYAGIMSLSGDTAGARKVQQGNFAMWTHFGIEPEEFNFRTWKIADPGYALRPENIECCFYLWRTTGDPRYQRMGKRMAGDILKRCRAGAGYATLKDVTAGTVSDSMESFFLAETLKYAWLLFAPESKFDLSRSVFNTEAHPMKVAGR